jgi:hypothetical protein
MKIRTNSTTTTTTASCLRSPPLHVVLLTLLLVGLGGSVADGQGIDDFACLDSEGNLLTDTAIQDRTCTTASEAVFYYDIQPAPITANGLQAGAPTDLHLWFGSIGNSIETAFDPGNFGLGLPVNGRLIVDFGPQFLYDFEAARIPIPNRIVELGLAMGNAVLGEPCNYRDDAERAAVVCAGWTADFGVTTNGPTEEPTSSPPLSMQSDLVNVVMVLTATRGDLVRLAAIEWESATAAHIRQSISNTDHGDKPLFDLLVNTNILGQLPLTNGIDSGSVPAPNASNSAAGTALPTSAPSPSVSVRGRELQVQAPLLPLQIIFDVAVSFRSSGQDYDAVAMVGEAFNSDEDRAAYTLRLRQTLNTAFADVTQVALLVEGATPQEDTGGGGSNVTTVNDGTDFNQVVYSTAQDQGFTGERGQLIGAKFAHVHPQFGTSSGLYHNANGTCFNSTIVDSNTTTYCRFDSECPDSEACVTADITASITVTVVDGVGDIIHKAVRQTVFTSESRFAVFQTNAGLFVYRELAETVDFQHVYPDTICENIASADLFSAGAPHAPRFFLFGPQSSDFGFPHPIVSDLLYDIDTDTTGTLRNGTTVIGKVELLQPAGAGGILLVSNNSGLIGNGNPALGGTLFAVPVQVGSIPGLYTVRVTMEDGAVADSRIVVDEATSSPTSGPSATPSKIPSVSPSVAPSAMPSNTLTGAPSLSPSFAPSGSPSETSAASLWLGQSRLAWVGVAIAFILL